LVFRWEQKLYLFFVPSVVTCLGPTLSSWAWALLHDYTIPHISSCHPAPTSNTPEALTSVISNLNAKTFLDNLEVALWYLLYFIFIFYLYFMTEVNMICWQN
jgi:hypothetical protein